MFGFLNPRPHSDDYRRAYARVCQHQRRHYGLSSLPFHSFEAVLLFQYAWDAGAFPSATIPNVRCCKLHCPTALTQGRDAAVGKLAASFGMLLGSIKIADDISDSNGFIAKTARWLLKKQIAKVHGFYERLAPGFRAQVSDYLTEHALLEQTNRPVAIEAYTAPTANAFGYVMSLLATAPGLENHREPLTALGRNLGRSIISYDAAIDFTRDRAQGHFNPIAQDSDRIDWLTHSIEQLEAMQQLLIAQFGPEARTVETIGKVKQRLVSQALAPRVVCAVKLPGPLTIARRLIGLPVIPAQISTGAPGGGFNNTGGNFGQDKINNINKQSGPSNDAVRDGLCTGCQIGCCALELCTCINC